MWNFDVREQARSTRYAPRVFVAGPMISTAKPPWSPPQVADPPLVVATTPEQARELVEKQALLKPDFRSEEHTSELQSLMRISYAVFCLKKTTYISLSTILSSLHLST